MPKQFNMRGADAMNVDYSPITRGAEATAASYMALGDAAAKIGDAAVTKIREKKKESLVKDLLNKGNYEESDEYRPFDSVFPDLAAGEPAAEGDTRPISEIASLRLQKDYKISRTEADMKVRRLMQTSTGRFLTSEGRGNIGAAYSELVGLGMPQSELQAMMEQHGRGAFENRDALSADRDEALASIMAPSQVGGREAASIQGETELDAIRARGEVQLDSVAASGGNQLANIAASGGESRETVATQGAQNRLTAEAQGDQNLRSIAASGAVSSDLAAQGASQNITQAGVESDLNLRNQMAVLGEAHQNALEQGDHQRAGMLRDQIALLGEKAGVDRDAKLQDHVNRMEETRVAGEQLMDRAAAAGDDQHMNAVSLEQLRSRNRLEEAQIIGDDEHLNRLSLINREFEADAELLQMKVRAGGGVQRTAGQERLFEFAQYATTNLDQAFQPHVSLAQLPGRQRLDGFAKSVTTHGWPGVTEDDLSSVKLYIGSGGEIVVEGGGDVSLEASQKEAVRKAIGGMYGGGKYRETVVALSQALGAQDISEEQASAFTYMLKDPNDEAFQLLSRMMVSRAKKASMGEGQSKETSLGDRKNPNAQDFTPVNLDTPIQGG